MKNPLICLIKSPLHWRTSGGPMLLSSSCLVCFDEISREWSVPVTFRLHPKITKKSKFRAHTQKPREIPQFWLLTLRGIQVGVGYRVFYRKSKNFDLKRGLNHDPSEGVLNSDIHILLARQYSWDRAKVWKFRIFISLDGPIISLPPLSDNLSPTPWKKLPGSVARRT